MANSGNKKARKVKGLGTIYYDNSKTQWVGLIEIGKYDNGRTKYKNCYGTSQNAVIDKMREYKIKHPEIINLESEKVELISVTDYFNNFVKTIKKTKLKPSSYTRELGIRELPTV